MKLIFTVLILSSAMAFGLSQVVQKTRVIEEKILSAQSCSIDGDYDQSGYGSAGYTYIVTMNVTASQKVETYSVQIGKSLSGKLSEKQVPNSTKPSVDRVTKTQQSITFQVRHPSLEAEQELLKACADEMVFINTGEYPPAPPKPVILPPVAPQPPVTPPSTDPLFPIVPEENPELPLPPIEPPPAITPEQN